MFKVRVRGPPRHRRGYHARGAQQLGGHDGGGRQGQSKGKLRWPPPFSKEVKEVTKARLKVGSGGRQGQSQGRLRRSSMPASR